MNLETAFAVVLSDEHEDEPWEIIVVPQDGVKQGVRCVAGTPGGRCPEYLGNEHQIWHFMDVLMPGCDGHYLRLYRPWIAVYLDCWRTQRCPRCHDDDEPAVVPVEYEAFNPERHAGLAWRRMPIWEPGGLTVTYNAPLGGQSHPISWICPELGDVYGPRSNEIEEELAAEAERREAEANRRRLAERQSQASEMQGRPTLRSGRPEQVPVPREPEPDVPTALYRYFDADGLLLYIGISRNLGSRVGSHSKRSSWMDFAASSKFERFPSWQAAKVSEQTAIESEHPLFNDTHNRTAEAQRRLVDYLIAKGRADLLMSAVSRG